MTASTSVQNLQDLKSAFAGPLIAEGHEEYDAARRVWNGMIDRRPLLIARCTGVADVIAAVNFAREQRMTLAVRGGGHNVAGFGTCDDGLVIDLSPMKGIRVDPEVGTVRAQGGVIWRELDHEAQAFGLATTGGLVSETGIAGLTLGGGIGWLMRKHGLTCDNLLSADVVAADGRYLTTSADRNPDLFWALRGGGGNFGIVTSFEYQLHPVGPVVAGGAVFHELGKADELLRFYREWVSTLPDELTTMVAFLTAPPEPFIPAELQGKHVVAVAACYAGPVDDGMKVLQPLKDFGPPAVDHVGPVPYLALQRMFDASAPRGIHSYWKTEYVSELTDAGVSTLIDRAGRLGSPFSAIHLHHVEGAVGRVAGSAMAFGKRDARFIVNVIGLWMEPALQTSEVGWVRDSWQALQPHASGGAYLNFMDSDEEGRVARAYGSNFDRLAEIKAKYDPENLFHVNQNIPPKR
jgi:FAD/FMN-containing dehydrogenase